MYVKSKNTFTIHLIGSYNIVFGFTINIYFGLLSKLSFISKPAVKINDQLSRER